MTSPRVADMSANAFHQMVSDPDVFVGGGSVAAVTGAAAASTALLVMRLNAQRKSLREQHADIEHAIADSHRIASECEAAADEDIQILAELLEAHRQWRSTGEGKRYVAALRSAAESPLRIAASIVRLLEIIERQLEISTRFTVSDLGAAAVLAGGAARAALLTAEVNIALLGEHPGVSPASVEELETTRASLHEQAMSRSDSIERRTRERLQRPARKDAA